MKSSKEIPSGEECSSVLQSPLLIYHTLFIDKKEMNKTNGHSNPWLKCVFQHNTLLEYPKNIIPKLEKCFGGLCKTMRFVILSLSKNLQDTAKAFKGRSISYVPQRDRQDDCWVLQSPLLDTTVYNYSKGESKRTLLKNDGRGFRGISNSESFV